MARYTERLQLTWCTRWGGGPPVARWICLILVHGERECLYDAALYDDGRPRIDPLGSDDVVERERLAVPLGPTPRPVSARPRRSKFVSTGPLDGEEVEP